MTPSGGMPEPETAGDAAERRDAGRCQDFNPGAPGFLYPAPRPRRMKRIMRMQTDISAENDTLDLIWGAEAIAAVINQTVRQTNYMLAKRQLPAKKVGGKWVASRRGLRRHFAEALNAA